MSIWPTQRWCTSQAAVWWVVRESVDWILFYASNFVWTSIDIITHEKWWILNLNTLKKQNMTSNWGSRIYLERKIKVSHTLVLFLIYKTLATLNVYYCFKSSLEPNSATSWSSYWEMFLFMMSMQGPSKRSKAWMSITGRKKRHFDSCHRHFRIFAFYMVRVSGCCIILPTVMFGKSTFSQISNHHTLKTHCFHRHRVVSI